MNFKKPEWLNEQVIVLIMIIIGFSIYFFVQEPYNQSIGYEKGLIEGKGLGETHYIYKLKQPDGYPANIEVKCPGDGWCYIYKITK